MTTSYLRPLSSIAFLTLVTAALIGVAERAGLPLALVRLSLSVVAAMALLAIIAFASTGREQDFAGFGLISPPVGGGLVLALVIGLPVELAWPANTAAEWSAGPLGAAAGVFVAHLVESYAMRGTSTRTPAALAGNRAGRLLTGFSCLALGAGLVLAALPGFAAELLLLFRLAPTAAQALAVAIPLVAVLAGGMRTTLSLAFAASAMVIATLAILTGAGLWSIGNLPLPGQSEAGTLLGVAEVRRNWSVASPMHLIDWPAWSDIFSGQALHRFGFGCLLGAGVSLAVAPALPVGRRSSAGMAILGLLIVPLLIVSIGGFALEAAAVRFIGMPIVRPPANLVEASQLGLLTICGASPVDAGSLRIACGVGPREAAVFTWRRIAISPAFTHAGLGTALGFPPSLALATAGFRLFLGLAATTLGLMLFALGLGFYLLARNRTAAGLASIRLGSTRLAAMGAAIALFAFWTEWQPLDPRLPAGLLAAGAVFQIAAAGARMLPRRVEAATGSGAVLPETPDDKRPPPSRRRKASAESKLA